jgi:hypothetical protein
MKPLMDALTKLLEKLFSAKMIWFIVVVVALLASLLLWYGNGSLPIVGGCKPDRTNDLLGLCTFIDGKLAEAGPPPTPATPGQKQRIGLILLVSIILIGVKVVLLVITWLRDKLFVRPSSEPPA